MHSLNMQPEPSRSVTQTHFNLTLNAAGRVNKALHDDIQLSDVSLSKINRADQETRRRVFLPYNINPMFGKVTFTSEGSDATLEDKARFLSDNRRWQGSLHVFSWMRCYRPPQEFGDSEAAAFYKEKMLDSLKLRMCREMFFISFAVPTFTQNCLAAEMWLDWVKWFQASTLVTDPFALQLSSGSQVLVCISIFPEQHTLMRRNIKTTYRESEWHWSNSGKVFSFHWILILDPKSLILECSRALCRGS